MEFGKEYHNRYYRKRRQKINEFLGGKCKRCGSTERLEVDHVNRKNKFFNVSQRLSVNRIAEELAKCQLLCLDCHREKTKLEQSGFRHGTIYAWMKRKCDCFACETAKRAWHDQRNTKRRCAPVSESEYELPSK